MNKITREQRIVLGDIYFFLKDLSTDRTQLIDLGAVGENLNKQIEQVFHCTYISPTLLTDSTREYLRFNSEYLENIDDKIL